MTPEIAQQNRFNGNVAIFYNPITQIDPREWNSIREFNGPFHPLLGEYKCDDPAVVRKHVQWMRRAGVDVIVYDIYGFRTWSITDLPKDRTLPLIVEELANQQNESRKLELVIWLEKWNANPSLEEYRYGLDYVSKQLASRDFYHRYQGKPLVLTYLNGEHPVIESIEREYGDRFTLQRIKPFKTDVWSYVETHPQTANRQWMPVNPGMDQFLEDAYIAKYVYDKPIDLPAVRQLVRAAVALREEGEFFQRQILRAREIDPEFIFISGWNDWQCCLQIEPAVEYEFKYVDLAARLLAANPKRTHTGYDAQPVNPPSDSTRFSGS